MSNIPRFTIAAHLRAEIIAIFREFPILNPEQIRSILISRGFTTKSAAPSISQISAICEISKSHNQGIKHSVTNILEDENEKKNISSSIDDEYETREQRRVRTSFTAQQLTILEQVFSINNYPDAFQREQIGIQTGLSDSRIQVWFSNRRARSRKHLIFNAIPNPSMSLPLPISSLPSILTSTNSNINNNNPEQQQPQKISIFQQSLPFPIPNLFSTVAANLSGGQLPTSTIFNAQTAAFASALLQFQLSINQKQCSI
uniref:Homeobox domain-containing protein n=1 Tax=Panagrolaimus sp. ES5 TaxID=591445 RepID=A0AC34FU59_9BILA